MKAADEVITDGNRCWCRTRILEENISQESCQNCPNKKLTWSWTKKATSGTS